MSFDPGCPKCSNVSPEGAKHCMYCGALLVLKTTGKSEEFQILYKSKFDGSNFKVDYSKGTPTFLVRRMDREIDHVVLYLLPTVTGKGMGFECGNWLIDRGPAPNLDPNNITSSEVLVGYRVLDWELTRDDAMKVQVEVAREANT